MLWNQQGSIDRDTEIFRSFTMNGQTCSNCLYGVLLIDLLRDKKEKIACHSCCPTEMDQLDNARFPLMDTNDVCGDWVYNEAKR